jgi:hypothetical protein
MCSNALSKLCRYAKSVKLTEIVIGSPSNGGTMSSRKNHIAPEIGHIALTKLTQLMLNEFMDEN